jgi:hypothetical protein
LVFSNLSFLIRDFDPPKVRLDDFLLRRLQEVPNIFVLDERSLSQEKLMMIPILFKAEQKKEGQGIIAPLWGLHPHTQQFSLWFSNREVCARWSQTPRFKARKKPAVGGLFSRFFPK